MAMKQQLVKIVHIMKKLNNVSNVKENTFHIRLIKDIQRHQKLISVYSTRHQVSEINLRLQ